MKIQALAVLDIGKTNKKITVFDTKLKLRDKVAHNFDTRIVDGVELEPLDDVREWMIEQLAKLSVQYEIQAIAISTHGAAVVTIDEDGQIACPVVSYTHEVDESLHDRFFQAAGNRDELQQRTATVEIRPLINPAKLLFFTRERWPDEWARVRTVLFLPQYFAYVLTGNVECDFTYVGCHSYLWDFGTWDWSDVTTQIGIEHALPGTPGPSWKSAGTVSPEISEQCALGPNVPVTVGIHDSNASLLPYLVSRTDSRFVLNSTGTWCVAMHPDTAVEFQAEEIGKSVFFNISAYGDPVKTSILAGGLEFESYSTVIKELHSASDFPKFDQTLYQRVISQRRYFIIPGILRGAGQFPDSRPRVVDGGREYLYEDIINGSVVPPLFQDLPAAFATLNLSIAFQSKIALERVGLKAGMDIFTEGGFRYNGDYNTLLATFFPENNVYLSDLEEATSFGAALTGLAMVEQTEPKAFADRVEIATYPVKAVSFDGLAAYESAFRSLT